ncbi:transporter substrate-binding domain-containing protein [Wolinella succinogenes]|uniref:BINDING COMPONENT OF ABC TRANSPORTER n=1 Tax=Wolinella succinogenes (strain ATCC 29543 / DSM 1740 / CCUG 13145 / JCM 31913 / LMG 7466 / NCTC 11488 / FDC 602W) TaxID=273121 RepID=Q7MAG0_WOLSU|nr:transporter substrate-binding domain-containing protein [Wolinella succinogenes]NLU34555.1 transporter substrate-binding domain-containing protein [Wolinella succinogenes]CAE09431.1 BINDING COMPONENT OF ABC TRANSPORTER [Wolinella succinogenes]VEG81644.1 Sulfate starvation-induced protein 7 [Wolinella succinogenes]HCZ18955.1 amino acid ABC transporter substrate-binding protein [Helicobacter sp.]
MKKIWLGILISVCTLLGADMSLWQKSTLNEIIKRGELRVGLEPGYLPFEMKDKKGNVIGFDVDLAREMAKAMGVKLKLVPTSWDGLIPGLVTEKFDIIISGMTISQERNLRVNFVEPYIVVGQSLLVKKGLEKGVKSYKDLDKPELTLVTKFGVSAEYAAKRLFKNAKLKTYDTEAEAVQEVLNGKADMFIFDLPFNVAFMAQKGQGYLVHLDTSLTYEPLGWAIKKGDPDFLNWLNHFLAQIKHDGSYDELYERWFVDTKWLEKIQ